MSNKVLSLLVCVIFISCTLKTRYGQIHFQNAIGYYENKNIAQASAEIDSAILIDTVNSDYVYLKAKIKTLAGLFAESNDLLFRLRVSRYKKDSVSFLIGENYFQLGKIFEFEKSDSSKKTEAYQFAANWYDSTIHINPKYFQAYFNKAKVLHNNGQYVDAINVINNALNIFPNEVKLIMARGITRYTLDDIDGGLKDLNFAINAGELDTPNVSEALRFRSEIFVHKDSLTAALFDINHSIRLYRQDFLAFVSRGLIYKRMGLKDSACTDFRTAADLGCTFIYSEIKSYCKN